MNRNNVGTLAVLAACVTIAFAAMTGCDIGTTAPRFITDPDSIDEENTDSPQPSADIGIFPVGILA